MQKREFDKSGMSGFAIAIEAKSVSVKKGVSVSMLRFFGWITALPDLLREIEETPYQKPQAKTPTNLFSNPRYLDRFLQPFVHLKLITAAIPKKTGARDSNTDRDNHR